MPSLTPHARTGCASRPRLLTIAIQAALLGLSAAGHAQSTSETSDSSRATTKTLDTVTVTGEREHPILGNVITIDAAELRNANSMADAIGNRPLISAPGSVAGHGNLWDGSGTNGYNIRGVEGNRIGLDTDGIELPAAASQPDAGSSYATGIGRDYIDPEVFRQVRIASGTPAAGGEGSGLGGQVSFLSKTPEDYLVDGKKTYLGLKLGYNGSDRSWNEAVTGAARFSDTLQGLAVYSRRDGHEGENYGDTPTSEATDWHSNALLTRFVWTPNDSNKLGLTLDLYERKDDRQLSAAAFVNAFTGASTYPYGANQLSTTKRNRISLDHQYRADAGFALFDRLKTTVYYQDSEKSDYTTAKNSTASYTRYIDTGLYTTSMGLNSEAVKQLSNTDTLTYGVSLNHTNERRPWTESRYSVSTGAAVSGYPTSSDRMAETDTTKLAVFARDEHAFTLWGHQAIFTPGIRGEYIHSAPGDLSHYSSTAASTVSSNTTSFIAPTLNLTYALTPSFDAYAQYSRGVRVPTAGEKTGVYDPGRGYAIIGNADLQNETSHSVELGTKGSIAPGVTLNASAFYTQYKNFIDYTQTTSAYYSLAYVMQNIANVDISGAEVSSKVELGQYISGANGYSAAVALGLTHGRSKDANGNTGGVNSVAPAKGNITLAYDDPGQRFGVNFTTSFAKSKQASDDASIGYTSSNSYYRVPGYARLDLGAYWNVARNMRVDVAINNLTNKKYWDYSSVRMLTSASLFESSSAAGRSASISTTLNF